MFFIILTPPSTSHHGADEEEYHAEEEVARILPGCRGTPAHLRKRDLVFCYNQVQPWQFWSQVAD